MRIFETIKADHHEIRLLLKELSMLGLRASKRRKDLCVELRDCLRTHAKAEEAVFYSEMSGDRRARLLTAEALEDHYVADAMACGLVETCEMASGEEWMAGFLSLKETLEHHMKAEELELFSRARRFLTRAEAEQMNGDYNDYKIEIEVVIRAH